MGEAICTSDSPWRCMTCRNLITTFDDGRSSTCRLPRFSALYMVLSASFSTLTRTIVPNAWGSPQATTAQGTNASGCLQRRQRGSLCRGEPSSAGGMLVMAGSWESCVHLRAFLAFGFRHIRLRSLPFRRTVHCRLCSLAERPGRLTSHRACQHFGSRHSLCSAPAS